MAPQYPQRRTPAVRPSPYARKPVPVNRARSTVPRPFPVRRVERKRLYYGLLSIQPSSSSINMYNPLYYLTPGTGRDQRIGNQVSRATLYYSMRLCALALTALSEGIDQSVFVRIVVFTHSKEWNSNSPNQWALNTGGTGTAITASELLKDSGADRHCQSYMNIDEVRVLHDRVVQLRREQTGPGNSPGPAKIVKGMVPLGNLRFQDGTNAYLRGDNVYVAVFSSTGSGVSVASNATVSTNFMLSYDDV